MTPPAPPRPPLRLGVNVDHVATLRNARGGARPDPLRAALLAVGAGAHGITVHLREDRRHVRDADLRAIKAALDAGGAPLNFEMAATEEMVAIAEALRPAAACLVPERREERTTEGGLDAAGGAARLAPLVARLAAAGCRVSLFVEADEAQLLAAVRLGAPVVELHTGRWCEALEAGEGEAAAAEFARLAHGAARAVALGLEPHAGHGLDTDSARALAAVPEFAEFNVGHFLIGEAVFLGLPEAVRRMRAAMDEGRAAAAPAPP